MTLLAFGINHNTAPVALRERLALNAEQLLPALRSAQSDGLNEVAILSTCNRMEIYASTTEPSESLLTWVNKYHRLGAAELQPCHYLKQGADALRHMMSVACGLDSLVLGEPQILGQMKSAYDSAKHANTVGRHLHDAFQQSFSIAKRVRTETSIGENPVSVAYAAVSLAQQIFSDLKKDSALLIGAGETIELVARHLHKQGLHRLCVANRSLGRAQNLVAEFGGDAVVLEDIPKVLHEADIVISSTASPLPVLGKGAVESALKKRKHKPMFMVDIAVPRDIETEVGDLSDVFLYTVDDLRDVIEENRRSRQKAAEQASDIIDQGVSRYLQTQKSLASVDLIKQLRSQAEQIKAKELEKAIKSLSGGADAEVVMTQLARNLTNKWLHGPTTNIRQASAEGREDQLDALSELWGIKD